MVVSEIRVKRIRVNQGIGVKYRETSFTKYIGILYLVRVGQYLARETIVLARSFKKVNFKNIVFTSLL